MAKRSKLNNLLIIALVLVGVMVMVILVGIFLPKPKEATALLPTIASIAPTATMMVLTMLAIPVAPFCSLPK